jgi:hypothetical protein
VEDMSNENAQETEVDQPLEEFSDSEGQVEDTGDAASEPEWGDEDLFNLDEYAEKPVRLKVDGEEIVVPLKEALSGYQRQADYTRKTQELSQQKKEIQMAAALQEALTADPVGTLELLQQHYGINATVQSEEEDAWQDPVIKELNELKNWKSQLEYERTLGQIEKEIQALENKYGEEFDREEVIAKALATGSTNLEETFKLIHFDKVYAEKQKATKEVQQTKVRTQAKREAQVVSGGTSSKGSGTAPVQAPKSVLDAWKAAEKSLGL